MSCPFASIAIAVSDDPIHRLVGATLRASLAKWSGQMALVGDGDPRALDADLLLMVGGGPSFEGYARLLRQRPGRPKTLLWQTESLPPGRLTPRAERIADCLTRADALTRANRTASRPSWTRHGLAELRRAVQRWRTHRFRRVMRRVDAQNWRKLRWHDLVFLTRQIQWLRRNASWPGGWIDHLVVSVSSRVASLRSYGIAADFVPVGYHPLWGTPQGATRDIDALFLGRTRTGERKRAVPAIITRLARRGFVTHIQERACYGNARTALVNRARILLNLTKFPWEFAGMRFLFGIGCGALIVSNTCEDTSPYVAGRHFVAGRTGDLADIATYYLEHEAERRALAERARRDLGTHLSIDATAAQLLRVARRNTAKVA